jgi:hypothetical protein
VTGRSGSAAMLTWMPFDRAEDYIIGKEDAPDLGLASFGI